MSIKNRILARLEELSKKTLGNYINSASSDKSHLAHEIGKINAKTYYPSGTTARDREIRDELNRKHGKRSGGIGLAVKKLTKESVDLDEGYKVGDYVNVTNPKATPRYKIIGKTKTHYHLEKPNGQTMHLPKARIAKVNKIRFDNMKKANESVEQVNELSKETLKSYVKGAASDNARLGVKLAHAGHENDMQKRLDVGDKLYKRREGINKALDKLTKESVEQVDEVMKLNKDNYVHHTGSTEDFAKEYVKGHKGQYADKATPKHDKDSLAFYDKYEYKHGKSGFGGSGEGTFINKKTGEKYHVKKTPSGKGFYGTDHHIMKESVEQVDEISKGKLDTYINKAIRNADDQKHTSETTMNAKKKATAERKLKNRNSGIRKALDKLYKENVDLEESVNKAIYNNTPENRSKLKLLRTKDGKYMKNVLGDVTSKYITHHIDKNEYRFHNQLLKGEKVRS